MLGGCPDLLPGSGKDAQLAVEERAGRGIGRAIALALSASGCDEGQAPCDEATRSVNACLVLDCIGCEPPSDTATFVCEGVALCNSRCIDDLDDISKVAGSSLTSGGFKKAIAQIREDAAE